MGATNAGALHDLLDKSWTRQSTSATEKWPTALCWLLDMFHASPGSLELDSSKPLARICSLKYLCFAGPAMCNSPFRHVTQDPVGHPYSFCLARNHFYYLSRRLILDLHFTTFQLLRPSHRNRINLMRIRCQCPCRILMVTPDPAQVP